MSCHRETSPGVWNDSHRTKSYIDGHLAFFQMMTMMISMKMSWMLWRRPSRVLPTEAIMQRQLRESFTRHGDDSRGQTNP